jgi:CheY-like chemotaxis protein
VIISGNRHFYKPEDLAKEIESQADVALCDHRLRPGGLADFDGAELAATLFERSIPAVLITQYYMDSDVSIRRWRRKVPVLMKRADVDPMKVKEGLLRCEAEIGGLPPKDRKPYEALVHVDEVRNESGEKVIDVMVTNWDPHQAVRLPMSLVPQNLHADLSSGMWLLAKVNVGAERPEDLYFEDIRLAPDPDPHDGLA